MWCCHHANSIDLSKVEFSYLYKDTNVNFDYSIAQQNGTYRLKLNMQLRKVGENDEIKNLKITTQKGFKSKKSTPVKIVSQNQTSSGSFVSYDVLLSPSDTRHQYLVIYFNFLTRPYVIDIPIGEKIAHPDFIINGKSNQLSLVKKSDTLLLEAAGGDIGAYNVKYYPDRFGPAAAPFASKYPDADSLLKVKRSDNVSNTVVVDESDCLVYFSHTSSSEHGAGRYIQRDYFPKNKEFDELIGPLKYISTEEEFAKLNKAKEKQLAFDKYWLAIIPSKRLAARTLRNFYARVQKASILFADYKNGWKTDRGMIYIAYGPPDEVWKTEDREIWKYDGYNGQLSFNFVKTPNELSQYHYVLERNKKMANDWYSQIDRWRKGDI